MGIWAAADIQRSPHDSVSFGGGNHLIKSGPRPGVASFEYAAPHWKDDDNDDPISYPPNARVVRKSLL